MTVDFATALRRVSEHTPRVRPPVGMRAATALIVSAQPEPQFVVIRRAEREGDRWSGHAALPGGKVDAADPDVESTARRETFEEVGIVLGETAGRLDDIGGRIQRGVVSTVVFALDEAVPFKCDPREVAAAHWVPMSVLADRKARVRYPSRCFGPWPAFDVRTGSAPPHDSLIVWGLTHRILSSFWSVANRDG